MRFTPLRRRSEPVSPECPHPAVGGPERLRALRLRQRGEPASPTGGLQPADYRRSSPGSSGMLPSSAKSPAREAGLKVRESSAAVAIGIARQGALDGGPGRRGGRWGALPLASRIAAIAGLVLPAQVALDIVEAATVITRTCLVAGAVGRAVVLVGVVGLVVGLVAVVLLPVLVFGGRVDALGHALAGQPAGHRACRRPDH